MRVNNTVPRRLDQTNDLVLRFEFQANDDGHPYTYLGPRTGNKPTTTGIVNITWEAPFFQVLAWDEVKLPLSLEEAGAGRPCVHCEILNRVDHKPITFGWPMLRNCPKSDLVVPAIRDAPTVNLLVDRRHMGHLRRVLRLAVEVGPAQRFQLIQDEFRPSMAE
ncbi:hypothetical protein PG985_007910 [Apiospora marii]|uniref:uncharacterized protein n=1 Tax=Apiospora marii TaxID=335849 RepID=UPI00312EF549